MLKVARVAGSGDLPVHPFGFHTAGSAVTIVEISTGSYRTEMPRITWTFVVRAYQSSSWAPNSS